MLLVWLPCCNIVSGALGRHTLWVTRRVIQLSPASFYRHDILRIKKLALLKNFCQVNFVDLSLPPAASAAAFIRLRALYNKITKQKIVDTKVATTLHTGHVHFLSKSSNLINLVSAGKSCSCNLKKLMWHGHVVYLSKTTTTSKSPNILGKLHSGHTHHHVKLPAPRRSIQFVYVCD